MHATHLCMVAGAMIRVIGVQTTLLLDVQAAKGIQQALRPDRAVDRRSGVSKICVFARQLLIPQAVE